MEAKKRQGQLGDTWYLDEVFIKIHGELSYLWRVVDQDRNNQCLVRSLANGSIG